MWEERVRFHRLRQRFSRRQGVPHPAAAIEGCWGQAHQRSGTSVVDYSLSAAELDVVGVLRKTIQHRCWALCWRAKSHDAGVSSEASRPWCEPGVAEQVFQI